MERDWLYAGLDGKGLVICGPGWKGTGYINIIRDARSTKHKIQYYYTLLGSKSFKFSITAASKKNYDRVLSGKSLRRLRSESIAVHVTN
jgi:hypothetical protein